MNFKIVMISLLSCFISTYLTAQNCTELKGEWINELGSVLQIDTISTEGHITGKYKSSTGVDGKHFNLQGYVNFDHDFPTEKNISFSVRWKGYGSITSWTGYCHTLDGQDQIKTMWHLVRSGKEFDWERVITNSSVFKPLK